MSESFAPAQTYQLNTLASVIGRYAPPDLSGDSLRQTSEMLDRVIHNVCSSDVPAVPHTNPTLLAEASAFDDALLLRMNNGPAAHFMSAQQHGAVTSFVQRHKDSCDEMFEKQATWQHLVTPDAIAVAYGLDALWSDPWSVIDDEITRWGKERAHPSVPAPLCQSTSLEETKALMDCMWRKVIQVGHPPDVYTYLQADVSNFHVYWAPLAERLDYVTPSGYSRATQLSFDLPHNATHLAHLDIMDSEAGALRYDDNMAMRAYFEAVTVFSEYKEIEIVETDPEFAEELSAILRTPQPIDPNVLKEWIVEDRKYECKLRAARYAADVLMLEGAGFADAISELSSRFGITANDAANEARKYLPWTGLGAVYTFGYRRLQELGVARVTDAMQYPNGTPIIAWQQWSSNNQV